jgi:hypothetical protein
MQPDVNIQSLRQHWPVEAPAMDLADRIVARAIAQPQHQPFARKFHAFLASLNPMQGEGFTGKGLAFAACLLAAIVIIDPSMTARPTSEHNPTVSKKELNRMLDEMMWDEVYY